MTAFRYFLFPFNLLGMRYLVLFMLIWAASYLKSSGQSMGIGTDAPDPNAILDLTADDKGILIPRMSTADRDANFTGLGLANEGLLIYNLTDQEFNYWDGTQWLGFPAATDADWYEDGTPPKSPDDINDNIYTYGKVGIGMNSPFRTLDIYGDMRIDGNGSHNIYGGPVGSIFMHSNSGISMDLESDGGSSGSFRVRNNVDFKIFEVLHSGDGYLAGDFHLEDDGNQILFEGTDPVDILLNTSNTSASLDIESQGGIDMVLDRDNDNASSEFTIKRNGDGTAAVNKLFTVPEDFSPLFYPYGTNSGETGGLRMRELEANGSNYVGLRAPNTISTSFQLTLPQNAGINSYLLQTDGTGILSWVDPSTLPGGTGPDNDWMISGNDVYKSIGTATIGTSSIAGWPLNIVNSTIRRSSVITHSYSGTLGSDAMYIDATNNASSGAGSVRAYYGKIDKLATSGSTGEVNGGYFWGINRYSGSSYSNSIGAFAKGEKYSGTSGNAYGLWAEGYNENGDFAYGIYAYASSPSLSTTIYAGFFGGDIAYVGGLINLSDSKFKTNVRPATGSLEKIMSIPVSNYDFRTDEYGYMNLPSGKQTGFIAQDFAPLFPELVKKAQFPASRPENVESGRESHHDVVDYLGINYTGLIPYIIQAIQEQQAQIEENALLRRENEDLRTEIEQLKTRLDALEKRK